MNKEFVCKIDGTSFLTKDEMMTHLSQQHLRTVTTDDNFHDVKEQLQKSFPGFLVEISKDIDFLGEERIDIDYEELKTKDLLYVILRSTSFHGTIGFGILKDCQMHFNRALQIFPSLESAATHLNQLFSSIKDCESQLLDLVKYHEPEILSINIAGFEHYHNRYENKYYVSFNAHFTNDLIKTFATLTIDCVDLENDEDLQTIIQRFVQFISGRYIDFLEGEVEEEYRDSSYSNDRVYTINGVDIATLAQRSKRMRITIVEEKSV